MTPIGLALAASLGLGGCQSLPSFEEMPNEVPTDSPTDIPLASPSSWPVEPVETTSIVETVTSLPPSRTPPSTPTPPRRVLTICLAEEPSSLYIFSESGQPWGHVGEALWDGPLEQRMFGYQPVILEKIPHWEDGDVQVLPVTVQPGEGMVAANGELVRLEAAVTYWTPEQTRAVAEVGKAITTIQMRVTFRLRPDVRWSDGEPLTAADSVFGFEVAASADTPTSKALAWRTAGYVAADAGTVIWTGVAGFLDNNYALNFSSPLPKHAYGHLSPAQLLSDKQVNRQPLGWGAFQVAEWVEGSYLRLVPNVHYFRRREGLPYLDEVRFIFTAAETEALSKLVAGDCQVAVRNQWDAWEAQAEALLVAEREGRLALQFVTGPMLEHLDFGILTAAGYSRMAGSDLFQNGTIRRAIAYCVDRQALADAVQWGKGAVAHSYVQPNHPLGVGDQLQTYPHDPERSRRLLTDAGWEDRNGDGIRSREGVPLILKHAVNYPLDYSGHLRQTLTEMIQVNLRQCGIDLVVLPLSGGEMYREWPDGVVFGRRFDLAQFAWLLPGQPRCELYTTAHIPQKGFEGGANNIGYSNSEFDAACEQALFARERVAAAVAHRLAQQIFVQNLPSLPLFFRLRIGVARPEVSGFQLDPTHPSPLWNIEAFDLAGVP